MNIRSTYQYLRSVTLYCFFTISACLFYTSSSAQLTWEFSKKNTLWDTKKNCKLNLFSRLPAPELTAGFKGTGLRTDGYSTWLTAKLPPSKSSRKGLNGYFALETYPTDTAGFFALCIDSKNCISACVDRFGKVMIGINSNGVIKYYSSNKTIQRFKWLNINLQLKNNEAQLKVNGVTVRSLKLPDSFDISAADSLVIGRDWRIKMVNIFPVTAINGIIDEISISDNGNWPKLNSAVFAKLRNDKPVLAIPPSRFEGDFSRPQYHLLPAANWTNETHGFIFYKSLYHIFNQKNGANLFLGQMNWGHFTSPDLVHWTEQLPALTPEPGYDQNGIWSGCSVLDANGKPVIIYTGGGNNTFGMCLAYPADTSLIAWKKYRGNPIIPVVPQQFARKDFHDPYVWQEKDNWYMIVGFGLEDKNVKKGTVLLYKSADLKKWMYLHPLFIGDPDKDDSGVFWEMPVFWKMGNKYILLVNKVPFKRKPAVALYWSGDFVNEQFVPDEAMPKKLEVINRLLSPSLTHDRDGNTTAIAIIPDETSAKETYSRGWTHLFSIPRIWTLENGKINQQPHPSLKTLRFAETTFATKTIDTTETLLISKGHQQLEISVDIIPGKSSKFGFIFGNDDRGKEMSKIYYDFKKQQLVIDQSQSSLRKNVPLQIRTGDYKLRSNEKLNLHLFIDGSVIEGFINNEDAFTTRIFPLDANSNQVEIFTAGGRVNLIQATVWRLKSAHIKTAF